MHNQIGTYIGNFISIGTTLYPQSLFQSYLWKKTTGDDKIHIFIINTLLLCIK